MTELASINLNRLVVFVAVVDTGSLTAAARRLGLTKTAVSTHMQRLETEVGASLLVRTTRRLSLTDAGEAFYEACRRIVSDAEVAVEAAGKDTAEPRGTLRVTATIDYGATVVAPVAVELQRRFPALHIELMAGDHVLDLAADGIDVAIRIGQLADSAYQAVRIGEFQYWLVASPTMLQERTGPSTLDDVKGMPLITLSVLQRPLTWIFRKKGQADQTLRFSSSLTVNTAFALRTAAVASGGLAILPDFAARDDVANGRLVRVLPDWNLPSGGIHAIFPATRHRPRKTRVFVEALRQYVENACKSQ